MNGTPVRLVRLPAAALDAAFPLVPDECIGAAIGPDGEELAALCGVRVPRLNDAEPWRLHAQVAVDERGQPRFLVTLLGADGPLLRISIGRNRSEWPLLAADGFLAITPAGADRFTPGGDWLAVAVLFRAAAQAL